MDKNSMSHIHLTKEDIIGEYDWKGNLDLINIIMLGLSNELPENDETYELHRLLGTLLSNRLSVEEKLGIIEKEYDIPIDRDIREDVGNMCNLSQGIIEEGIAIGEKRGITIGEERGEARGKALTETKIIQKLYKNGFSIEQIADATDKDIEEVKAIIEGKELAVTK